MKLASRVSLCSLCPLSTPGRDEHKLSHAVRANEDVRRLSSYCTLTWINHSTYDSVSNLSIAIKLRHSLSDCFQPVKRQGTSDILMPSDPSLSSYQTRSHSAPALACVTVTGRKSTTLKKMVTYDRQTEPKRRTCSKARSSRIVHVFPE